MQDCFSSLPITREENSETNKQSMIPAGTKHGTMIKAPPNFSKVFFIFFIFFAFPPTRHRPVSKLFRRPPHYISKRKRKHSEGGSLTTTGKVQRQQASSISKGLEERGTDSSAHSFSRLICSSSSGVKSFWMLKVLRISSGDFPLIIFATVLQPTSRRGLMSR